MTRGNQRDKDRARAQARAAKNAGGKSNKAKVGGANKDADALAAKIALKKKLKEEGKLDDKKKGKDRGSKYVSKKKGSSMVNPHTGKKDAQWTQKMSKKKGK